MSTREAGVSTREAGVSTREGGARRGAARRQAASGTLTHRRQDLALAIIGAAQLMVMLDLTIVNVALPTIGRALGFSATGLAWVINAYVVAFGGLLLLGGRSGDLFGRRRMFVAGVLAFSLASLAGGLATGQAALIAARAIQGAGAAIASPTALSLIAATFADGPARHRAMAVYAAMSGAGGGLGLLVGGLLTEWASWRWVLFVNVPIGLLVATGAALVLDPGAGRARPGRLDLPGAAAVTAGTALLAYGLSRAADSGWSGTGTIVSLLAAGALLAGFALIEARSSQPLLPPRMLASRNRAGGYAIMLLLGAAMLSLIFFMTQFFQDVLGYSPIVTGLAILPLPVTVGTVSQITSRLVTRAGIRPPLTMGPLVLAAGLAWLSMISAREGYPAALGPLLLAGLGMGLSFVPLTLNTVSGVRHEEVGLASGLLNTSQQIGGSLGLAVLVAVAATVTRSAVRAAVTAAGHAGRQAAARAPVPAHALVAGYDGAFRVGAAIAAVAFLVAVAALRAAPAPRVPGPPPAGAPEGAVSRGSPVR